MSRAEACATIAGAVMLSALAAWSYHGTRDRQRVAEQRAAEDAQRAEVLASKPPPRLPEIWCLWCKQPERIQSLAVDATGEFLVTTGRMAPWGPEPLIVRFWNVTDGGMRQVLEMPEGAGHPVRLRHGRLYMPGLAGIDVVDAETGRRIDTVGYNFGRLHGFDVSPDGKRFAVCESNHRTHETTLELRNAADGEKVYSLLSHRSDFGAQVSFSTNGDVVISCAGNTIFFWNAYTGEFLGDAKAPNRRGYPTINYPAYSKLVDFPSSVDGICCSSTGRLCAFTDATRADLRVYDLDASEEHFMFPGGFASPAFSPDEKYLAAIEFTPRRGEWDFPKWGDICVWDMKSGRLLARNHRLKSHEPTRADLGSSLRRSLQSRRPPLLVFGPDGKCLFTGDDSGQIYRWDLREVLPPA
jgi:WD40 repeat protein